jgi:hypothetical protein
VLPKSLMNSRRSMGFPRAEGHVGQVDNIRFSDRELCRETLPGQAAHVRFGSKADIEAVSADVRFTPKSGNSGSGCLLCAKSGHYRILPDRLPEVGPSHSPLTKPQCHTLSWLAW